MSRIIKCEICEFGFDANDPRGSIGGCFTSCPLCRALSPMSGYSWSVKNDCNGIFETFCWKSDAKKALAENYAGIGAYVVPSVIIEVPDQGLLRVYANMAESDREKWRGDDA